MKLKGHNKISLEKIDKASDVTGVVGTNFTKGRKGIAPYLENFAEDPTAYQNHLKHLEDLSAGTLGFNHRGSELYSKIIDLYTASNRRSAFAQTGIPGGGQIQSLIDLPLTDFSNGYFNDNYIANKILTDAPVVMRTGRIGAYGNQHNVALDKESVLAEGAASVQQVPTRDMEFDNYHVRTYALQDIVTPDDRMNTLRPFEPEEDITISLKQLLMLCCEIDLANQILNAASYPSGHTKTLANATDKFSDRENSDVHGEAQLGRNAVLKSSGVEVNTAAMDKLVFEALSRHPQVLGQVFNTMSTDRTANMEQVAQVLQVDNLYVGKASRAASADRNSALSRVWGKDIWLGHIDDTKSLRQKSFGYFHHFATSDAFVISRQGILNPMNKEIFSYMSWQHHILNYNCGYLIKGAIV